MIGEMLALKHSGTWNLVPLPPQKTIVRCRWVYATNVGLNGDIDCLKAHLVTREYAQTYGLNYSNTFSRVAKMASVRIFLSMAAMSHWPLHQLDIKNAFLHGDLKEKI